MDLQFAHEWPHQRVVFAPGDAARAVAEEVKALESERLMVIAGHSESDLADRIVAELPVALRHDEVVMHVPVEVAERARVAAATANADAILSVGGGSTTGLAKAVALTTGLPIVAVPTTYAGSEATSVWGLTERSRKTTGVDARVLPRSVVYDADLTMTLPVPLSVASGLNALAHCVDSMWAPRADPIDRAVASEGIAALHTGLPLVVDDAHDTQGRQLSLYGAYLSAIAFSSAGSGLHHKICHVLGGMFGLPHAQTHAVVLPHVLALNAPHSPNSAARIARALDASDALTGLLALRDRVDAPRALRDLGLAEDDLASAVEPILEAAPSDNPAPLDPETITRVLHAASEGSDPS